MEARVRSIDFLHVRMRTMAFGLGTVLVMTAWLGCWWFFDRTEVLRVRSPNGRADAILVELGGGPTTDVVYDVYVVGPGGPARGQNMAAELVEATRNAHAYGAMLRWLSPTEVLVEYYAAQSARVVKQDTVPRLGPVTVTLRAGVQDPTAPAGGMAYNQRRGR
jgi:hypothetical protein